MKDRLKEYLYARADTGAYMPTPEEIAAHTKRFREEHLRRKKKSKPKNRELEAQLSRRMSEGGVSGEVRRGGPHS